MKVVRPYILNPHGKTIVMELPKGSKILGIFDLEGEEAIYVEFEEVEARNTVLRTIQVYGDFERIPSKSEHIMSFAAHEKMWHVYDHGETLKPLGG